MSGCCEELQVFVAKAPSRRKAAAATVAVLMVMYLLTVLTLSLTPVAAFSVHYELDKDYYHPGDSGLLLLVSSNDGPSDVLIFGAYMNVSGVGNFEWILSGLAQVTNLPPGVHAYQLAIGQMVKIQIPFTTPADTKPGNYPYSWTIIYSGGSPYGEPMSNSGMLSVIVPGQTPPAPVAGELPLSFITVVGLVVVVLGLLVGAVRRRVGGKNGGKRQVSSEIVRFKMRARAWTRLSLLLNSFLHTVVYGRFADRPGTQRAIHVSISP